MDAKMTASEIRNAYTVARKEYADVVQLLAQMPDNKLLRESFARLEAAKFDALDAYLSLPSKERTLRF